MQPEEYSDMETNEDTTGVLVNFTSASTTNSTDQQSTGISFNNILEFITSEGVAHFLEFTGWIALVLVVGALFLWYVRKRIRELRPRYEPCHFGLQQVAKDPTSGELLFEPDTPAVIATLSRTRQELAAARREYIPVTIYPPPPPQIHVEAPSTEDFNPFLKVPKPKKF